MSNVLLREGATRSLPATYLADFYLEEIRKHQEWLQRQREFYTERAVSDVEAALSRVVAQLERLCLQEDAPNVVSRLLKQLDVVTGLSAWSPTQKYH
ncbi:MAG: hypothetical protein U0Q12_09345 [Vicinamibacterales bacterium]|mgnify:CR=1 FL=1